MPIAFKHLPSPLTGEGAGGGEDSTSFSPIPTFPRQRGKGYSPTRVSPHCGAELDEGEQIDTC
jgi:hypothetical protein